MKITTPIFADEVELKCSPGDLDKLRSAVQEKNTLPGLPDFHGIPVSVSTSVPDGEVQVHRVESGRCKCITLPVLDDPPPRHPMTAMEKEVLREFWKMFLSNEAEKLESKKTLLTAAALATDKWRAFTAFVLADMTEVDPVLMELKEAMDKLCDVVTSEVDRIYPETKPQP